ncbi:MAG TPA: helix-turn-helix domain-containing protein [Thermomicrobiales bacterium]|jgi:excisionase family DNA binding protein|nr:helix-turn-helix domain-containing protein [Thermomicrobiales bacterium]
MTDPGVPEASIAPASDDGADDLLTIDEAAEHLKVSAVTISRWRRQGRLPTLKVGPRAVRIRRSDLDRVSQPYHGPLSSLETPAAGAATTAPSASPAVEPAYPPVERTLARAELLRATILSRRGGDFLDPAADDMGKLRDKRAKRRS